MKDDKLGMSGSMIDQSQIDLYYKKKKGEVSNWLTEYTTSLKRVTEDQRKQLIEYAKGLSFDNVGRFNQYAQQLTTISMKDKKRLKKYLQEIDWLPEGITAGFLDGQLVVKMLPNIQAEEMIREAFGSEEEGDNSSDK